MQDIHRVTGEAFTTKYIFDRIQDTLVAPQAGSVSGGEKTYSHAGNFT